MRFEQIAVFASLAAKPVYAAIEAQLGPGRHIQDVEESQGFRGRRELDIEPDALEEELCDYPLDEHPTIECPADVTNAYADGSCNYATGEPSPDINDKACGVLREDLTCFLNNGTQNIFAIGPCPGVLNESAAYDGPCFLDPQNSVTYPGPDGISTGMNSVLCTITDRSQNMSSNSATCSYDVTVTDNQDPSCSANDINQYADYGSCAWLADLTDLESSVNSTDNCGVESVVLDVEGTTIDTNYSFPAGAPPDDSTEVTATVTDINGNTGTCSFDVYVSDNEAPTAVCPDPDPCLENDWNKCDATAYYANQIKYASSDNCEVDSVSLTDYGPYEVGSNGPVTATVYDIYGNSAQCFFTVQVSDTESPVIQCIHRKTPIYSYTELFKVADNCGAPLTVTCEDVNHNERQWTGLPLTDCDYYGGSSPCTPYYSAGTQISGTTLAGYGTCTAVDAAGNEATCDHFFGSVPTCY